MAKTRKDPPKLFVPYTDFRELDVAKTLRLLETAEPNFADRVAINKSSGVDKCIVLLGMKSDEGTYIRGCSITRAVFGNARRSSPWLQGLSIAEAGEWLKVGRPRPPQGKSFVLDRAVVKKDKEEIALLLSANEYCFWWNSSRMLHDPEFKARLKRNIEGPKIPLNIFDGSKHDDPSPK